MIWLVARMKWVMVLSGALTLTMVHALISPSSALRTTFGDTLEGPLAEIVVRNWGALIALVGAMLIYGAFQSNSRKLVLVVAGLSKVTFIALVFTLGPQYLASAGVAIVFDSIMVLLFATYLIATKREMSVA